MKLHTGLVFAGLLAIGLTSYSCANGDTASSGGNGGSTGNGGNTSSGGNTGSGGSTAKGGSTGNGGSTAKGGNTGSGGSVSGSGGSTAKGGNTGSGGTGAATGSGGSSATGSGGSSTTGSGGTTSVGTCVSGTSTTPSAALITDFSDAKASTTAAGNFTFGSTTGLAGGTSLFGNSTGTLALATGGGLTFSTTVPAPTTATMYPDSGFVVYVNGPPCVNANAYTGVSFNLSVTGTCVVVFSFVDAEHTKPTDDPDRGTCTASNCYAGQFTVTTSTTVNFTATPSNPGSPATAIDPAKLTGVEWQLQDPSGATSSCTGSVTVGDISFK